MPLFHIHVDASWLSNDFEGFLTCVLGFSRTDFVAADGSKAEPLNHFTLKAHTSQEFRRAFETVVAYARVNRAMAGYVEGEFISLDKEISSNPFNPDVPAPCKLRLNSLPVGSFRESEIHLTLCPERSDPHLLKKLSDMGLLMIYMPKPWGIALIYTAQGTRNLIKALVHKLSTFLESAGGAVACSIKEERIARWWVSDRSVVLPPVVHAISLGDKE